MALPASGEGGFMLKPKRGRESRDVKEEVEVAFTARLFFRFLLFFPRLLLLTYSLTCLLTYFLS